VTGERLILAEGGLQELLADLGLLIVGEVEPVLLDELAGLDSGELAKVGALVRDQDVEESCERGRVAVVCLVQGGSCGLDTLGVGCCSRSASKTQVARRKDKLTGHQTLEESDKLLLIHDEYVWGIMKGKEKAINNKGTETRLWERMSKGKAVLFVRV
jgi:hypothetical protein